MKLLGLAVAAMFAAMALAPAAGAAPAKSEPYSKDQIAAGMKGAPEVVQASGTPCQVVDAAKVNEGMAKNPDDPKAKDVKVVSYEVACQNGMGYIFQRYEGLPIKSYDCISLSSSPSPCRLPENADVNRMASAIVAQAGTTCSVTQTRPLGATKAGDRFFEVACKEGPGYIVKASSPADGGKVVAQDCSRSLGTQLECKLTSKEQITAALNAKVAALVAASGKPCQVDKSREVGATADGTMYYEAACSAGAGYMIAAKDGRYVRSIDCANASGLAGGCTLTDATKAESAESATYTRLSKEAGFDCSVGRYRYIGVDKNNNEVVELQCTNRPDGRIAQFPADNKGPTHFYDCIQAGALGQSCKLSDVAADYPRYTDALRAKGKTSCKVSGARWLGVTPDGTDYVETACSDGLPGWVIAETPTGQVKDLLSCGQAKSAGVACALPTNLK